MKDDTISRAAAINAICEDGTQLERQGQYTMTMAERKQRDADILGELPSAQQWIPCKERLPEDEEEVIVSVRDDSGDNTLDYSSCGWYACAGDFWVVDNEPNYHVVAWMPLPESWKGGKE